MIWWFSPYFWKHPFGLLVTTILQNDERPCTTDHDAWKVTSISLECHDCQWSIQQSYADTDTTSIATVPNSIRLLFRGGMKIWYTSLIL